MRRRSAFVFTTSALVGAVLALAQPAPGAAAAPLAVATSSASSTSTSSTFSIQRPSSVQPGDLLLASVAVRLDSAAKVTPPAGWALVRSDTNGGTSSTFLQAVYSKIAGPAESASYAWRFSSSRRATGGIVAYRGVDPAAPIAAHGGQFSKYTALSAAPCAAAVEGGRLVVFFGATGSTGIAPASPLVLRYYAAGLGSATTSVAAAEAPADQPAGGPCTATLSASVSSTVGQIVVLRPSGGSVPAPAPAPTTPPTEPAPDFAVSAAPSSLSLVAGGSATATVRVSGSNGFGAAVALSATGLPAGTAASFTPTVVTGTGQAELALVVPGVAAAGTYSVRIVGTSGGASRTATVTLAVGAPTPPGGVGSALPSALPSSTGQTFYVSPLGSDSNPGTLTSPWRTIQKAMNTLTAGQRALVRAGTYTENLTFSRAGTPTAPITIEAYASERPVLVSAGGHPLRVASTGAYLRFSGFVIEKHPGTSGGNVDVYGHHVEISGNEIRAGTDQGIYTAEESHHLQILGNWIHDNGKGLTHQSHGIYLQGDDHLVAHNLIHDHPKGFGIQVYDRNSRSTIVHNTITASGFAGIVVGGSGGVDTIVIRNNIIARNAQHGVATDSSCPTGAVWVEHNVLYANGWGAIETGCSKLSTAGGNTTADPLFADYASRDHHLRAGSAALGIGIPEWAPRADYDGGARPQGSGVDAGAYEGA